MLFIALLVLMLVAENSQLLHSGLQRCTKRAPTESAYRRRCSSRPIPAPSHRLHQCSAIPRRRTSLPRREAQGVFPIKRRQDAASPLGERNFTRTGLRCPRLAPSLGQVVHARPRMGFPSHAATQRLPERAMKL